MRIGTYLHNIGTHEKPISTLTSDSRVKIPLTNNINEFTKYLLSKMEVTYFNYNGSSRYYLLIKSSALMHDEL